MRTYRAKDITDIHLIIQAIYMAFKGKWHRTSGKKPRKALQKAFNSTKKAIQGFFEKRFKDL